MEKWEHLRTYFIEHALPLQAPPLPNPFDPQKRKIRGVWIAGEHGYPASIQWSLYAGRRTGEQIVAETRAV